MSLEEYEPNPEFIGRNFNAGEVVQLVLKAPYSGHWLSFRSVVMVMMHELAHCKQMNHSGAFWKVRNQYATEMRDLWAKGYSGDGFWSRGKTLLSGQYEPLRNTDPEILPENLCGGTFRSSRNRKRKRKGPGSGEKKTRSYAERQQNRIARKFGVQGVKLGDDEEERLKLEDGKKPKGKPRVAGSARGRDLRAAAALARFGQQQDEVVKKEESDKESDTDSEYEETRVHDTPALNVDASRLVDSKGNSMVKVCEDEDKDEDTHVKEEMQELQDLNSILPERERIEKPMKNEDGNGLESRNGNTVNQNRKTHVSSKGGKDFSSLSEPTLETPPDKVELKTETVCPICSMINVPSNLVCAACLHVLDTTRMPGHWRCQSSTCMGGYYINAVDCVICGVCGSRKPAG